MAFYFSLTRWSLFDATFIGLDNYELFLKDQQLSLAFRNTIIYAVLTSGEGDTHRHSTDKHREIDNTPEKPLELNHGCQQYCNKQGNYHLKPTG